jgi:hypothetical protein
MFLHDASKKDFAPVAVMFILVGAAIFTYGAVAWIYNTYYQENFVAVPSFKLVGGLAIMALGYIQLELDMLRKK